jgi:two-component sensor histidine kinase
VNFDITDRKRAEANAQVLMAEVNHRARNMLAVVQVAAQQSARPGDPQTFAARLSDRINGLAANQDLLAKSLWHGVDIAELVLAQLAHFKDMIGLRIHVQGPALILTAAASQTVGMALHELSTNAAKYGSLSNAAGKVRVEWHTSAGPDPVFSMSWIESDGPPVKPRTRTGFGQTVIKRLVEVSLGSTVEVDYAAEGLCWRLRAPGINVLVPSGK